MKSEFETKLKKAEIVRTNIKSFKDKRFGNLENQNEEFDFEGDSDLDNFDENGDILNDGMSIDEDPNFKNKEKLKNEKEEENYESGTESDEVSLD